MRIRFKPRNERAGHKAIRQHVLQCRVFSAGCKSLSHCILSRVAAVELIGHSELYKFSLLSNQYGP